MKVSLRGAGATFGLLAILMLSRLPLAGQEKSVRPGINKPFENPDVKDFVGKFEVESREVYARRKEIVAACGLKPGMAVADVGAGTGLFTRLFARAVGPTGKVFAVDISRNFVRYIEKTAKEAGLANVTGIVCTATSVELPAASVDLVFICDTYHHFEFPFKTLKSIHRALRPHGQMVVVDFKRIKGVSSEWVMNHVRAGQKTVTREIEASGFKLAQEKNLLKDNYVLRFERVKLSKQP
jgi:ubiquinone/menaquinone biosynthesis C-methylase UbiE